MNKFLSGILAAVMNSLRTLTRIERHLLDIKSTLAIQDQKLDRQDKKLDKILAEVTPLPAVRLSFTFEMEGQIQEGELKGMKAGGSANYKVTPADEFGNPAKLDGPLDAAVSDETIVRIESKSDDGLTGVIRSVGLLGTANFSVDGDADLGSGIKKVVGQATITVDQPGEVTQLKVEIEEQP